MGIYFFISISIQLFVLIVALYAARKSVWAFRAASAARQQAMNASVRTTQQLEALGNLYRKTGLRWGDLPPTRGWAASPDFLNIVYDVVIESRPEVVVELGSGASTIVTALALKRNGSGKLYTIDHDESYLEKTEINIDRLGLKSYVTGQHRPLVWRKIDGQSTRWYDIAEDAFIDEIDVLIVDGPPEPEVGEGGRSPVIHLLFGKLSHDGLVLFDDADRPGEQAIFQEISTLCPEFVIERVPAEKGAAIVKRSG